MAAAAGSLKAQAQELVQTVAVFKLAAGESPARIEAPVKQARVAPPAPKAAAPAAPAKQTKQAPPVLKAPPPKVMDRVASAAADGEWETF
jgi:methyl-accepting chemotaxis protein